MFGTKTHGITKIVFFALILGALLVVSACGGTAADGTVVPTVDTIDDTGADVDTDLDADADTDADTGADTGDDAATTPGQLPDLAETPADGEMADDDMAGGESLEATAAVATTLYESPAADAAEVAPVDEGAPITLDGQRDVDGTVWVHAILESGEEGWMMSSDVTTDGDMTTLGQM